MAYEVPQLPSPLLEPQSESEDDQENEPGPTFKARSKGLKYTVLEHFGTEPEFNQWWSDEKRNWTYHSRAENIDDNVESWFCKFSGKYSDRRAVNCNARLRIYFSLANNSVTVMRCENQHDHEGGQGPKGLPEDLKQRVRQMSSQGVTPKRIHVALTKDRYEPLPSLAQIQWFVDRQRPKAAATLTDADIRAYCEKASAVPEDHDKPYVLAYEISNTQSFYIVWTTRKLLDRQLKAKHLQADATSSTNWHNYPLLVVGHSDLDRHFTTTMLAVGKSEDKFVYGGIFKALSELAYRPTHVLGDGAGAITSAAKKYFPNHVRVMCFAHVIRRVDVKKTILPPKLQEQFRHHVIMLQYARNPVEFSRLAELMVAHWLTIDAAGVQEFVNYFRSTWLDGDLFAFFEGVSDSVVNNNGLEAVNGGIKRDHTLRKLQAFPVFLEKVDEILNYWSVNDKEVPQKPAIPLKTFKAAHQLQKQCSGQLGPRRLYLKISGAQEYVFSSASSNHKTNDELYEAYRRSFFYGPPTWKEYLETRFSVHLVEPATSGAYHICSCRDGAKKVPCKHAVMIMCAQAGQLEYPPEATAQPMVNNRKRPVKSNSQQGRSQQGNSQESNIQQGNSQENNGREPLAKRQNRFAASH